jgi:hypothetical protein
MSRYRDQLASALAAVEILSPTRYAWLGRRSRPLDTAIEHALTADERRAYLLSCLGEELYRSFYCHGRPVLPRWGEPEPESTDRGLAAAMSRANGGRGTWDPGWMVDSVDGSEAVVIRDGLRARVPLAACRTTAEPGAAAAVRLPKELPELSPGYFTVVGETSDASPSAPLVRVYWNVTLAGAPRLVAELTARLNAAAAPFRVKLADHRFRLDRCDAAVLYLRADVFRALDGTLENVTAALGPHLRPRVPAFTRQHAPGVGLAEDDGGRDSFGVDRCRLLAEAVVDLHDRGSAADRVDAVAAHFASAGVGIDAPYLAPSLAGRHVL